MKSSGEIKKLMDYYVLQEQNTYCEQCSMGDVVVNMTLELRHSSLRAFFRIGKNNMYLIRDIRKFINDVYTQQMVVYGQGLAFVHNQGAFDRGTLPLIRTLLELTQDRYYCEEKKYLIPDGRALDMLINVYEGMTINVVRDSFETEMKVVRENPRLKVSITVDGETNGAFVSVDNIYFLDGGLCGYVIYDNTIYMCDNEFYSEMREFLKFMSSDNEGMSDYYVSPDDYGIFITTLLPRLKKYADVTTTVSFEDYDIRQPEFSLYFDYEINKVVTCKARVSYDGEEFNLIRPVGNGQNFRDLQAEFRVKTLVEAYLPKITSDKELYYLERDDNRLFALIEEGISRLRDVATVYVTDSFSKIKVVSGGKMSAGVRIEGGLLEVSWDMDDMPVDELAEILDSYRQKKQYHRLRNGEFLKLDDSGFQVLSQFQKGLLLSNTDLINGKIEVPVFRALYLDAVFRDNSEKMIIQCDEAFSNLTSRINNLDICDVKIPELLDDKLRQYQKTGVKWLQTLSTYGFGGILADDMGLGKTLQILTFLSINRRGTSLVICPASLMYNWENECKKFVPDMKVLILAGTAKERKQLISDYDSYDIVITSYDLLKRDTMLFEGKEFEYQIIDEAQYIKNASTQTSKAVKSISSRCRFALTGTPVENRLSELWSIFEYLMPGYLFDYEIFRDDYEQGIVRFGDEVLLSSLKKMIRPFILRRLKSDVLSDLPDKLEEVIYTKIDGEQERLYKAHEKQLVMNIGKVSNTAQINRIEILAELTKLRQICCDPSLLYDDYRSSSAKLEACTELVTDAVNSEHKILIFSQFSTMLEIIRKRLDSIGITTFMLTGKTDKKERNRLVNEFQSGNADVFLISLKAGGTGLNLTAADIVIHYDPWWNVAAQNQASDRAHRIGQNNVVSVFKLIAKDTIEERILRIQEQKQNLADQIVADTASAIQALSNDNLKELLDIYYLNTTN